MKSFNIEISKTVIQIYAFNESTERYCAGFLTDEEPDYTITMTEEDLKNEVSNSNNGGVYVNEEISALYRKIADLLVEDGIVVFHSSAINVDGNGFLITARSGVGKSTHAKLLEEYKDNALSYHLSDEDFYVYIIAHEYKHYSGGGTGLRSLLDTYVCLKKLDLDMDYIALETDKMGLRDFEQNNRSLALHLFDGSPLSDEDQAMLEYILCSGTYGTLYHSVRNEIEKKGRWGYLRSRLTLPYDVMKIRYPVLEKLPVLYPFCWVHRILHGLVTNRKVVMYQLRTALFGKTAFRK